MKNIDSYIIYIVICVLMALYEIYLWIDRWLSAHTDLHERCERFRRRKITITPEEKQKHLERKKWSMRKFRLCFVCHGNICT
ncbi:MAG: hypothetical protein K6C68_09035 [Ruminococcus sp.]|nr:hypothetical protein [Ruminococcus sp.]